MKKQPQRTCMGCNEKKDKKDLIRIVKNKDNEKIIELIEQNVELNQLRTTLAKQIGDRIISPK